LYSIHRIVYQLFNGLIKEDGLQIDHINGDKTDNRISNLRLVTGSTNQKNKAKQSNNKTGVTGVVKDVKVIKGKVFEYFVALIYDHDAQKTRREHFSISKLGYDNAFKQACERRNQHMNYLTTLDAGFTDRHGT
jgi:hypothetical protein